MINIKNKKTIKTIKNTNLSFWTLFIGELKNVFNFRKTDEKNHSNHNCSNNWF